MMIRSKSRIAGRPARRRAVVVVGAFLMAVSSIGVRAHHSTSGYDYTPAGALTFKAKVITNHWVNPHSFVELDVPQGRSGGHEVWNVETGNPSINAKMGWKKDSLKPAMIVTIKVHPARNGTLHGTASVTTLPDGTKLYGPAARLIGEAPGQ